jgi:hypothetical protein
MAGVDERPAPDFASVAGRISRHAAPESPEMRVLSAAEARARRLRLMDVKRTEELAARLRCLRAVGFNGHDAVPAWIHDRLTEIRDVGAVADATLPESADDATVRSWIASFVTDAGIGDRFNVLTGIRHYPWMDCDVCGDRWLDDLIEQVGDGSYDLVLVSYAGDVLVVIDDDEWEYRAFRVSG